MAIYTLIQGSPASDSLACAQCSDQATRILEILISWPTAAIVVAFSVALSIWSVRKDLARQVKRIRVVIKNFFL